MAFGGGTDEVVAPDEEVAREVCRVVRVFRRELQALVLETVDDMGLYIYAGSLGFVMELLPALVEGGVGSSQPRRAAITL